MPKHKIGSVIQSVFFGNLVGWLSISVLGGIPLYILLDKKEEVKQKLNPNHSTSHQQQRIDTTPKPVPKETPNRPIPKPWRTSTKREKQNFRRVPHTPASIKAAKEERMKMFIWKLNRARESLSTQNDPIKRKELKKHIASLENWIRRLEYLNPNDRSTWSHSKMK